MTVIEVITPFSSVKAKYDNGGIEPKLSDCRSSAVSFDLRNIKPLQFEFCLLTLPCNYLCIIYELRLFCAMKNIVARLLHIRLM